MLKAVLVDLGETLVGFRPRTYELIANELKESGYDVPPIRVYRTMMRLMGSYNYPDDDGNSPFDLKEFLFELGIVSDSLFKRINEVVRYGDTHFLYDDAIPFLEGVRSLGLRTVLVSNATPRAKKIVEEYNLSSYLDYTLFSCDVGLVKPNPRIFSLAVGKTGSPAVHVGDIYEIDVVGAKRAFVTPILLDRFNLYEGMEGLKARDLHDALRKIEEIHLDHEDLIQPSRSTST